MQYSSLGKTGLRVPAIVFGTTSLGNLYRVLPAGEKQAIVGQWFEQLPPPVFVDTAGKYGAGLALEVLGRELARLGIAPEGVIISNKLGWLRVPLRTAEPTFEPGAWVELEHDAEQHISYDGILRCWQQGCELLGSGYRPQLVSVHDPDEYLARAKTDRQREARWRDIVDAYRALDELKQQGLVLGVGVGAKDWRVLREMAERVELDWVMIANSLTLWTHPRELLDFVDSLMGRGIGVINAAVFHSGFLVGSDYFDYRAVGRELPADRQLREWRDRFQALCRQFDVEPVDAGLQFALSPPGVQSVAINSDTAERVGQNVASLEARVPRAFWNAMKDAGLIDRDFPYVA